MCQMQLGFWEKKNKKKHLIFLPIVGMFEFYKITKLRRFPIISLFVIIGLIVIISAERNADVVFQFPEYDYKETSKNV